MKPVVNACMCGCVSSVVLNKLKIPYTKQTKLQVLTENIHKIPKIVLIECLKKSGKSTSGTKLELIKRMF